MAHTLPPLDFTRFRFTRFAPLYMYGRDRRTKIPRFPLPARQIGYCVTDIISKDIAPMDASVSISKKVQGFSKNSCENEGSRQKKLEACGSEVHG